MIWVIFVSLFGLKAKKLIMYKVIHLNYGFVYIIIN